MTETRVQERVYPKYGWVYRTSRSVLTRVDDVLDVLARTRGIDPRQKGREDHVGPVLHDPSSLPEFSAAVQRILHARERDEAVAVFGDYDVDGVSATALLSEVFQHLGMRAVTHLPHRERDGYGITPNIVHALVPPARLLVTVDNGTSAHEALNAARQRGADVIVIDHHAIPVELPEGVLIVNPKRGESTYPFPHLSAVGLAYTLAERLLGSVGRGDEAKWLLDLVALGTIADRVPLVGENRELVLWGLRVLRETPRVGLQALAKRAGVDLRSCDADAVSFRLVPRLNAAGRMEHADIALHLLTTRDDKDAHSLAARIHELNEERRRITDDALGSIEESVVRTLPLSSIVCVSGPWPPGILGIIAGRLAETTGRPAVVIAIQEDTCVASVRGNGDTHMVEVLSGMAPLLTKFGGHAAAAGCTFPRAELAAVEEYLRSLQLPLPDEHRPALTIDAAIEPDMVTAELADILSVFEPHGQGNERPVFVLRDLVVQESRRLGASGNHMRLKVANRAAQFPPFSAIAFRWGQQPVPDQGMRLDIAIEIHRDFFSGRRRVDLHIRDLQSSNASVTTAADSHHDVPSPTLP